MALFVLLLIPWRRNFAWCKESKTVTLVLYCHWYLPVPSCTSWYHFYLIWLLYRKGSLFCLPTFVSLLFLSCFAVSLVSLEYRVQCVLDCPTGVFALHFNWIVWAERSETAFLWSLNLCFLLCCARFYWSHPNFARTLLYFLFLLLPQLVVLSLLAGNQYKNINCQIFHISLCLYVCGLRSHQ